VEENHAVERKLSTTSLRSQGNRLAALESALSRKSKNPRELREFFH